MKGPGQVYKLVNLLSLDIVAGAVLSALFFARIFHVDLLPAGLFSLGLAVWIIYTADHLLDAKNLREAASSERHRFHQTYFKGLSWLVVIAVVVGVVMVFFVRRQVLEAGLILAVVVGIYFLSQRYLGVFKEVSGALLYSAGVLLPALVLNNFSVNTFQGLLILQFVFTALCNLILFSWFDHAADLRDRHRSFVTVMGELKTKRILFFLFSLNCLFIALQLYFEVQSFAALLIIVIMNFVLFIIFIFRRYFESNDLYRMFGETVFLIPGIYLWM